MAVSVCVTFDVKVYICPCPGENGTGAFPYIDVSLEPTLTRLALSWHALQAERDLVKSKTDALVRVRTLSTELDILLKREKCVSRWRSRAQIEPWRAMATFAMGCFWGAEAAMGGVEGVLKTEVIHISIPIIVEPFG